MSNQEKQEFEQSRPSTPDEQSQSEATIEDLSPNDRKAKDVRGGVLPPHGTPTVYVLPPET